MQLPGASHGGSHRRGDRKGGAAGAIGLRRAALASLLEGRSALDLLPTRSTCHPAISLGIPQHFTSTIGQADPEASVLLMSYRQPAPAFQDQRRVELGGVIP